MLARIVGNNHEEFVRSLYDPTRPIPKGMGVTKRIMEWLREAFATVRDALGFAGRQPLTFEEFVNMPLKSLYDEASQTRFRTALRKLAKDSAFGEDFAETTVEEMAEGAECEAEIQSVITEAKANGTYMKAPNGKPSNLSERQGAQVRTTPFKKWFGDRELAAKKKFLLNHEAVATLTGNEFAKVEGKSLTEQVDEYFKGLGGVAHSPIYGKVTLDKKGAEDSLAHGMGRLKAIAYASVKDVIENGIVVDYDINHKNRNYDSAMIAAPIKIGDERYICQVVITVKNGDSRFYLHEVTPQKNLLDAVSVTNLAQRPSAHQGDFAKVLKDIVTANEDASKVIDENGEPLVVYHGTHLFNASNPDIRFRFIGEQGASNLDTADVATIRMDNLKIAKQMERQKRGSDYIHYSTGWHRGKDGKWRYETEDYLDTLNMGGSEYAKAKIKEYEGKREEMINEIHDIDRERYEIDVALRTEEMSEAKRKKLKERQRNLTEKKALLFSRVQAKDDAEAGEVSLEIMLGEDNPLFSAYPPMRHKLVRFKSAEEMGTSAGMVVGDIITLREGMTPTYLREVLAHEIQHLVQAEEGFARGGSSKYVRKEVEYRLADLQSKAAKDGTSAKLQAYEQSEEVARLLDDIASGKEVEQSDYQLISSLAMKAYDDIANRSEKIDKVIDNTNMPPAKAAKEIQKKIRSNGKKSLRSITQEEFQLLDEISTLENALKNKDDYDLYVSLAGEVEADAVMRRLGLTPAQRQGTPVEYNEGIYRAEQIVLTDEADEAEMGNQVKNRMAKIARTLEGSELTPEQKIVADTFTGKANNKPFKFTRMDGAHTIVMRQGTEGRNGKINGSGTKYAVLRHFDRSEGEFTAEDTILIPEIVSGGSLEQKTEGKRRKNVYKHAVGGVTYTVVTNVRDGREEFHDFYTNRKSSKPLASRDAELLSNTPEGALSIGSEDSDAKLRNNRDTHKGTKQSRAASLSRELNTPITVVTDVEAIKQRQDYQRADAATKATMLRSKGWFDPATGEVVIVMPNNRDAHDIEQTMLHEIVAHKGLRQLIGAERMSQFCMSLFDNASPEIKAVVTRMALSKYKGRIDVAMEEYLASLAEKGFADMNAEEKTFWGKIKELVHKLLQGLGISKTAELTDNELRYLLWQSYNNLRNGDNPIGQAASIVKRQDLGLNEPDRLFRDSDDLSRQIADEAIELFIAL